MHQSAHPRFRSWYSVAQGSERRRGRTSSKAVISIIADLNSRWSQTFNITVIGDTIFRTLQNTV